MTVRISRAHYRPEQIERVEALMKAGSVSLIPAIQALAGLVDYYVAVNYESGIIVNVSVWETNEDALQMASLQPMLDQRVKFEAAGVTFEPTVNHKVLWSV